MDLVIGTTHGLYLTNGSGAPAPAPDLAGRCVQHVSRVGDAVYAGTDSGLFRSFDRGESWQGVGLAGYTVWDLAVSPLDARTLFAVTQPAAVFRSRDGGRSWTEIESFRTVPGAGQWCVPFTPPEPGRARTIVLDPTDPARWWIGIEVGGIVCTEDAGETWRCLVPGCPPDVALNPDIHTMTRHPERGTLFASTGYGRIDRSEPRETRSAGVFASEDGGKSWRYTWTARARS